MRKKMYVGKSPDGLHCFLKWGLEDGKFSASGYYLNKSGSDHCCSGQILDQVAEDFPDNPQVQSMCRVWRRWHLNDVRAGSPRQQEYINSEVKPAFKVYQDTVRGHNQKHRQAESKLRERIKTARWNQQDDVDRLFKKFIDSITIGMKVEAYRRYLGPREEVLTHGCFGGDAPKRVSITDVEAKILKNGPLKEVSWYDFCCAHLERVGLLVDGEYLGEVEEVIHGIKQKVKVGYKYGSRWLKEELPQEVVDEINSWVEVPFNDKTPIELLSDKWGCSLQFDGDDIKVHGRKHYLLQFSGLEFPYFCGSESDRNPETALTCVLRDAYAGKDGYHAALDYLIEELNYEYKDAKSLAKALNETFNKINRAGLWDEEVEDLASEL